METKLEQMYPKPQQLVLKPQLLDSDTSGTCQEDNQKMQVHNMHSSGNQKKRRLNYEYQNIQHYKMGCAHLRLDTLVMISHTESAQSVDGYMRGQMEAIMYINHSFRLQQLRCISFEKKNIAYDAHHTYFI